MSIIKNKTVFFLIFSLLIATTDVLLKLFIMQFFADNNQIIYAVFNGLNIQQVWNTGISFGFFKNIHTIFIITFKIAVISFLIFWLNKSVITIERFGISMIIGGALGNLHDRLRFGAVFDFIDFYFQTYHWPSFNLADSCIVIGVGILLYSSFQEKRT